MTLDEWLQRWAIPPQALAELVNVPGYEALPLSRRAESEGALQSLVLLEASDTRGRVKLFRNNVGGAYMIKPRDLCPECQANASKRLVRYGLANDTPELNKVVKSGDLIGWERVLITPEMLGTIIARFVSRECKAPDWHWTGTDREQAQLRWATMINNDGGNAAIVNSEGSLT